MLNKIKDEPALVGAFLTLVGAVLGVFIHNPALVAALITSAGFFLGVRQVVTPVTTAAAKITDAATTAATEVVKSLDETTIGAVNEVGTVAQNVINNAVDKTVGQILGGNK